MFSAETGLPETQARLSSLVNKQVGGGGGVDLYLDCDCDIPGHGSQGLASPLGPRCDGHSLRQYTGRGTGGRVAV